MCRSFLSDLSVHLLSQKGLGEPDNWQFQIGGGGRGENSRLKHALKKSLKLIFALRIHYTPLTRALSERKKKNVDALSFWRRFNTLAGNRGVRAALIRGNYFCRRNEWQLLIPHGDTVASSGSHFCLSLRDCGETDWAVILVFRVTVQCSVVQISFLQQNSSLSSAQSVCGSVLLLMIRIYTQKVVKLNL